ncbi:hypothetical protein CYMTET_21725 [Cymbomonas tetramitiformis]|uniref:Uncharacterized protein n=1 Tax=Cymbomonas tetramitiformis TaxID=36881 RepID=A0AAE0G1G3_9CHLO|nr:hypothetical protein CYMTET_21725 [Cymbomonas tetramitiformis]
MDAAGPTLMIFRAWIAVGDSAGAAGAQQYSVKEKGAQTARARNCGTGAQATPPDEEDAEEVPQWIWDELTELKKVYADVVGMELPKGRELSRRHARWYEDLVEVGVHAMEHVPAARACTGGAGRRVSQTRLRADLCKRRAQGSKGAIPLRSLQALVVAIYQAWAQSDGGAAVREKQPLETDGKPSALVTSSEYAVLLNEVAALKALVQGNRAGAGQRQRQPQQERDACLQEYSGLMALSLSLS